MFNKYIFTFLAIAIAPFLCNPIIAMDQPDHLRIRNEAHAQIIRTVKSDSLVLFNQLVANFTGSLEDIRENGHSLLHIAAMHNAVNMVQHLVQERGFNPKQPNSAQEFAIDLAKRRGNLRIVDYLAQAHALQEKKAAHQTEDELFAALADQMYQELQKEKSTCSICFDAKPNADFCYLSCTHTSCTACLNAMIDLAIKEKSTQSLCCPDKNCKKKNPQTLKLEPKKFTELDIKQITQDQAKIRALADIQTQEWIAQQPNAKHCPTRDCSWAFINDAKPPVITHCAQCQADYCSECLINHDIKSSCKDARADKETEKWKQENTKPCPKCKAAIEKNKGCLHMTCLKCKHEFCWECMRPYAEKGHGPYNCSLKPIRNPQPQAEESDESDDYSIDALMRSLPQGPLRIIPPRPYHPQPIAMDVTGRREERRLLEALTQINELVRHARDIRVRGEQEIQQLSIERDIRTFANRLQLYHGSLHKILHDTHFVERFIGLSREQREEWVRQMNIRIYQAPVLDSPAQLAVSWLEELEQIEQSSGRPVRPPHAFISDRPERFIQTGNRPHPAYIIEFTQRNNPNFVWNFLNSIRHRFLRNELVLMPNIDGIETLYIYTNYTNLPQERLQGILDEANEYFARQQRNSGNDIPE